MTMCKDRGWGKKAKPLLGKKVGSIIKERTLLQALIKELKPGQVAMMDHASFHTSEKTKALMESASCQLIFFPPYSPDLNPKIWANMKRWMKHKLTQSDTVYDTLALFFKLQLLLLESVRVDIKRKKSLRCFLFR